MRRTNTLIATCVLLSLFLFGGCATREQTAALVATTTTLGATAVGIPPAGALAVGGASALATLAILPGEPPPPDCVTYTERITYEPIMDGVTAPPMGLQRTRVPCAVPHDANVQPEIAGYAKTKVGTGEDALSPMTLEELDGMWKRMEQPAAATDYDTAYDYYVCEIRNKKRSAKEKKDCGPAPEDS